MGGEEPVMAVQVTDAVLAFTTSSMPTRILRQRSASSTDRAWHLSKARVMTECQPHADFGKLFGAGHGVLRGMPALRMRYRMAVFETP